MQIDSIDSALLNRLWNAIFEIFLNDWTQSVPWVEKSLYWSRALWEYFYKAQVTDIPPQRRVALREVNDHFTGSDWFVVYDYVEFFVQYALLSDKAQKARFVSRVQTALTEEMSGYRLLGQKVVQFTSDQELASIEACEALGGRFALASGHIREAVRKLADRKSPDYRNSIKESVSAFEAICRIVTGEGSLSAALKSLNQQGIIMHPAIRGAFDKLYAYTSDAEGIRHALLDQVTLDQDDAKFMLVACSALVNLVKARATG